MEIFSKFGAVEVSGKNFYRLLQAGEAGGSSVCCDHSSSLVMTSVLYTQGCSSHLPITTLRFSRY